MLHLRAKLIFGTFRFCANADHGWTILAKRQPRNFYGNVFSQLQRGAPSTSNGHRCDVTHICRLMSTEKNGVKKEVELIGEKFKDSLELLEDAKSSFGTVYFSEDMKEAEALIEETLSDFNRLLTKLNDDQKREVRQTIQLKMNELRAQLEILKENARNTLN